ncbi:MAG: hypothetical protein IJN92_08705 [Lachnospiraceae bacterium]|nr:hypothetical protein [Lachnospiraceae bacterium]
MGWIWGCYVSVMGVMWGYISKKSQNEDLTNRKKYTMIMKKQKRKQKIEKEKGKEKQSNDSTKM